MAKKRSWECFYKNCKTKDFDSIVVNDGCVIKVVGGKELKLRIPKGKLRVRRRDKVLVEKEYVAMLEGFCRCSDYHGYKAQDVRMVYPIVGDWEVWMPSKYVLMSNDGAAIVVEKSSYYDFYRRDVYGFLELHVIKNRKHSVYTLGIFADSSGGIYQQEFEEITKKIINYKLQEGGEYGARKNNRV